MVDERQCECGEEVCCCARLTHKSARGKGSCPAAFWATAGQADPAQPFPTFRCGPRQSVMVYTTPAAATSDMEGHAEVATPSLEKAKATGGDPITVLQPFTHQVGGHTQLLVLDHGTLCKPLIQRELHFYLNVPRGMKSFLPQYKGVIQVQKMDNSPTIYHPVRGRKKSYEECEDKHSRVQKHKTSPELRVQIHSCSDKKLVKEEKQLYSRPNPRYLLLLENVASNFHKPCILDVKMGTRLHGDDAPPDKRNRQMAKCAASTSARLGVRLCGMQIYQPNFDGYVCKDKYYGRSLDENGVRSALSQFFFNGLHLRVSLIRKVIQCLIELRKAIEKQPTFRFYSSSLLILYEGCTRGIEEENEDFFGLLKNDTSYFDEMEKYGVDSMMDDESSFESSNDSTSASASLSWLSSHKMSIESKKCKVAHGPEVDVRMIDFAHTTYEGYDGDTTKHSGPDTGYLLGLDNLIRLLREVETQSGSVREK